MRIMLFCQGLLLTSLMLVANICYADPDPKDVIALVSPTNYETADAYWKMLLDYGLVNAADQQAQTVVFESNFREQVEVSVQPINLFGDAGEELVVKMNFDNSSYYIHFFYHGTDDNWFKMEQSLDYHVPNYKTKTNRLISVKFAELYKEGEFALLVEKTSATDVENFQTWMSIWRVLPERLQMLHSRVFTEESYTTRRHTEMDIEESMFFPKTLIFKTHLSKMHYKEIEVDGLVEEEESHSEIITTEEHCRLQSDEKQPCLCKELKTDRSVLKQGEVSKTK